MIFTIGHSTRTIEEFMGLLEENGVTHVVDVRRYPVSRRHPQFARDALAAALRKHAIGYTHEPDLGGRRSARADSPNAAWRNPGFRGYADYMQTSQFQTALARVMSTLAKHRTTLLCAEAVPWRCHRNMISDALLARGVEVVHITGPGQSVVHQLNAQARILPDGRIMYPAPDDDQLGLL